MSHSTTGGLTAGAGIRYVWLVVVWRVAVLFGQSFSIEESLSC